MNTTAPLFSLVSKSDRRGFERLRSIENEYQTELIAEDARQLVQYSAAALRFQAGYAANTLRAVSAMLTGRDATAALETIADDVSVLVGGMDRLSLTTRGDPEEFTVQIMMQSPTVLDGLQPSLTEQFERIARGLLREQKMLRGISTKMRESYDGSALGFRIEADKWLASGMRRSGRDREEDFRDALQLLRGAVNDPMGARDYAAWFQIGWLLWKHEENLSAAEDAFYRAQRLSATQGDIYHHKSLRHLAYSQYLQGRVNEAYDTIQKALSISSDHDTRFDAARYAATRGNTAKCMEYLELCIRERPTTVIAMFAEVDFLRGGGAVKFASDMAGLASRMLAEARSRAEDNVAHWRAALAAVRAAEERAGILVTIPPEMDEHSMEDVPHLNNLDYLMALDIERKAVASGDTVLSVARETLKREIRTRVIVASKLQADVEEAQYEHKKSLSHAATWREEQLAAMPTLMRHIHGRGSALGLLFPVLGIVLEATSLPMVSTFIGNTPVFYTLGPLAITPRSIYLATSWVAYSYIVYGIFVVFGQMFSSMSKQRIERQYQELLRDSDVRMASRVDEIRQRALKATQERERAEQALQLLAEL